MRILLYYSSFLIFSFYFISCKSDSKPTVVGKWKAVDANMRRMKEEDRKDFLENFTVEFTSDRRYIASSTRNTVNGTYIYNENEKIFTVHFQKGSREEEQIYHIESLDKNRMVFFNDEGRIILSRK